MDNKKTLPVSLPVVFNKYILISLGFLSFSVPFFFSNSQFLTGTLVNATLFLTAIFLPKKYFLPIIIFPSLGVLSRGIIFGPFTPFLIYFLPIIWLGNFLLILSFRIFFARLPRLPRVKTRGAQSRGANIFQSIIFASLIKWILLYSIAKIYFSFHLIPNIFLQTMGIYQFITACLGGLIAFFIYRKYYG